MVQNFFLIEIWTIKSIRPSNDIFSGMTSAITFAKKKHAAQKIFKPEHA